MVMSSRNYFDQSQLLTILLLKESECSFKECRLFTFAPLALQKIHHFLSSCIDIDNVTPGRYGTLDPVGTNGFCGSTSSTPQTADLHVLCPT